MEIFKDKDMSEEKNSIYTLPEGEKLLRALFEQTAMGIGISSPEGCFLHVNDRLCEILGYSREELLLKTFLDFLHPDDLEKERLYMKQMLAGEINNFSKETRLIRKEREIIWVNAIFTIIKEDDGNTVFFLKIIEDITKKKGLEQELKESKEKYQAYFEQSSDGVVIINPEDASFIEFNDQVCMQLGYTREEFSKLTISDIDALQTKEEVRQTIRRVIEKGREDFETIQKTKTGEIRNVLVSAIIIKISDKIVYHCIWKDITEFRRNEKELIKVREEAEISGLKLKESYKLGKMGSWELDIEKETFTFTDNFYELFHTNAKEIGGYQMSIADYANRFLFPDDAPLVAEENRKAIETTDPNYSRYLEHRVCFGDGSQGYISVKFFVVKDSQGKTIKTYGINQDITEKKYYENELIKAKEESEKISDQLRETQRQLKLKLDHILSPDSELQNLILTDVIDLELLQKIQDSFVKATGVASIITDIDGKPITKPSNFTGVCNLVRQTEKGRLNCFESDKIIGLKAAQENKPFYQKYLSCGFVDAGAPIMVSGKQLAIWMIGQSNIGKVDRDRIYKYAIEIDADTDLMLSEYEKMQNMSIEQFENVTDFLWLLASEISNFAFNNLKLAKNIEKLKKYEKELILSKEKAEKSETKFRAIFEQAAVGIGLSTPDGFIIRVNKKLCEILGYSEEELLAKTLKDIIHPDDFVKGFFYMQLVITGEKDKFYENIRFIRKDDEIVWVKVTASLSRKADNTPDYFIGILEDITQKRLFENTLKESESRYRIVADYTSDWEFWLDPDNNFVYISPSCKKITGYEADEFYLKPSLIREIIHPDDKKIFDEHTCIAYDMSENKITFRIVSKEGGIKWIDHVCLPIYDEKNKFMGMRGSNRDITDLKRNEELLNSRVFLMEYAASHSLDDVMKMALDKAEELTASKIGFFHFLEEDQKTLILQMWSTNSLMNMCKAEGKGMHYPVQKAGVWADCILERQAIIHNNYESLPYKKGIPPGHAPVIREMIMPIFRGEKIVAIIGVGNKDFNYDEKDLNILHDFGNIIWDIIHEKKLEKEKEALENQLRQSQKMEALGTLSGGIAHDFNNILSIIFGNAELSKTMIEPHSPVQKYLNTILTAGNRAKDLVQQILTFSKKLDKERKPLEIYLIIKEFVKMLRSSIPTTIEINNEIDPNSGIILSDPTHIHQILMNLCTNASYSMREKGGVLGIKLKPVLISELDSFENGLIISPGNYVMLEVSDTGTGIDKKILDKIFEPYFTTKPMGEGTGLGLAVVHGIVKSYGGYISVDTEKDQGTTFKVYFPRFESESIKDETRIKTQTPRGIENILLVDDEVEIVDLTKAILEYLGYNVMDFTCSTLALKAFSKAPNSFDLVITDMTMPEMTGIDLSREMHAIRPDIPVILCTGFSQLVDKEKSGTLGFCEYLTKPVSMTELAVTVRNVLDSRKG